MTPAFELSLPERVPSGKSVNEITRVGTPPEGRMKASRLKGWNTGRELRCGRQGTNVLLS